MFLGSIPITEIAVTTSAHLQSIQTLIFLLFCCQKKGNNMCVSRQYSRCCSFVETVLCRPFNNKVLTKVEKQSVGFFLDSIAETMVTTYNCFVSTFSASKQDVDKRGNYVFFSWQHSRNCSDNSFVPISRNPCWNSYRGGFFDLVFDLCRSPLGDLYLAFWHGIIYK